MLCRVCIVLPFYCVSFFWWVAFWILVTLHFMLATFELTLVILCFMFEMQMLKLSSLPLVTVPQVMVFIILLLLCVIYLVLYRLLYTYVATIYTCISMHYKINAVFNWFSSHNDHKWCIFNIMYTAQLQYVKYIEISIKTTIVINLMVSKLFPCLCVFPYLHVQKICSGFKTLWYCLSDLEQPATMLLVSCSNWTMRGMRDIQAKRVPHFQLLGLNQQRNPKGRNVSRSRTWGGISQDGAKMAKSLLTQRSENRTDPCQSCQSQP